MLVQHVLCDVVAHIVIECFRRGCSNVGSTRSL